MHVHTLSFSNNTPQNINLTIGTGYYPPELSNINVHCLIFQVSKDSGELLCPQPQWLLQQSHLSPRH